MFSTSHLLKVEILMSFNVLPPSTQSYLLKVEILMSFNAHIWLQTEESTESRNFNEF